MPKPDDYKKVSRYAIAGNQHNGPMFLAGIRAKPLKAIALGVVFAALAVALLTVDTAGSSKFSNPWQSLTLALIAGVMAVFFFYQSLRGFLENKPDGR